MARGRRTRAACSTASVQPSPAAQAYSRAMVNIEAASAPSRRMGPRGRSGWTSCNRCRSIQTLLRRSVMTANSSGYRACVGRGSPGSSRWLHGFDPWQPLRVGLKHGRVHVALAAHRRRVTEPGGHGLDGLHDVFFRLRGGCKRLKIAQHDAGKNRPGPGAEILGGEMLAADLRGGTR